NPSAESLVLLNPDVYISSVSYDVNTKANILNEPAYQSINAIINKQVYVVDDNKTSRNSHLSIKLIKELALIVYPEYYE
ncbi:MAG: ABC transporter substrate-binding protein, partial [Bacilli bacterium]